MLVSGNIEMNPRERENVKVIFSVGQSEGPCEDGSNGFGSITFSKLCSIRTTGGFRTSAALHCCYYDYYYYYKSCYSHGIPTRRTCSNASLQNYSSPLCTDRFRGVPHLLLNVKCVLSFRGKVVGAPCSAVTSYYYEVTRYRA
jgi:hypothetical protein